MPRTIVGVALLLAGCSVETFPDDAAFHASLRPATVDPPLPLDYPSYHSLDREGEWCASAPFLGKEVVVWRVRGGGTPIRLAAKSVSELRLSPDGRQLLVTDFMEGASFLYKLDDPSRPTRIEADQVPFAVRTREGHRLRKPELEAKGDWVILADGLRRGDRLLKTDLIHDAFFTRDGGHVLTCHADGTLRAWELGSEATLQAAVKITPAVQDVRWRSADEPALVLCERGPARWISFDPRPREVRVGGERITWGPATEVVPRARLSLQVDWTYGDGVDVAMRVSNTGAGDAPMVVGRLGETRVHFGTVPAGGSVERRVTIPAPDRISTITLSLDEPPPCRWLYVPKIEGDYAALARKIAAESGKILGVQAQVVFLPPDRIGFVADESKIYLQNHPALDPAAFAAIRRILDADSDEEVRRWGPLLLHFYVPHEMVHVARGGKAGWREEYVADLIQPYLVPKTAPWSEDELRQILEHVERVTRPRVDPAHVRAIEDFLARDGEGEALPISPWDLFAAEPAAYVWFGVRVNLHALSLRTRLEDLMRRFLKE